MIRIHLSPHRGIQSIACLIALVAPTVHGAPQGRVSAQAAWATQSAPAVPDSPDQNPGKEPDEPAWYNIECSAHANHITFLNALDQKGAANNDRS